MTKHKSPQYELVVQIRDASGNPTGQTKTISTNDPAELDSFLERNTGTPKGKKRAGKKAASKDNTIKSKLFKELDKLIAIDRSLDPSSMPLNTIIADNAKNIIAGTVDLMKYKPRVVPVGDSIQLEFNNRNNEKELEIEFATTSSIYYLMWSGKNKETGECAINDKNKVRDLIKWLNSK